MCVYRSFSLFTTMLNNEKYENVINMKKMFNFILMEILKDMCFSSCSFISN